MFKKIALVGIFAVASVVSFGTSLNTAGAATSKPVVASPVVKGLGPCTAWVGQQFCH